MYNKAAFTHVTVSENLSINTTSVYFEHFQMMTADVLPQ